MPPRHPRHISMSHASAAHPKLSSEPSLFDPGICSRIPKDLLTNHRKSGTATPDLEEASQQLIFAPKGFANTALSKGFLTYLLHADASGSPSHLHQGAPPSWDDGMCVAKQCRRPFWKQRSPWQIKTFKTKAPKAGMRGAKGSPFGPQKRSLCCIGLRGSCPCGATYRYSLLVDGCCSSCYTGAPLKSFGFKGQVRRPTRSHEQPAGENSSKDFRFPRFFGFPRFCPLLSRPSLRST